MNSTMNKDPKRKYNKELTKAIICQLHALDSPQHQLQHLLQLSFPIWMFQHLDT